MISSLKSGLFVTLCLCVCLDAAKDDTLTQKAYGKDVTEAVLRKLDRLKVFPEDYSFLIRLAYVESKFGFDQDTFRTDYFGGIWQVEESVFRITQRNHSSLAPIYRVVQNKLGINWQQLTWKHLHIPLYSGLAAAMYFTRVPEKIPDTLAQQELHWRKYYRPLGEINRFINDSNELRNETKCRGKMDMTLILDGSGSILPADFRKAKDFVASVIEQFTIDYSRFGMVLYAADARAVFNLNQNLTIAQMATTVRGIFQPGGGTRTDKAIELALNMHNATKPTDGRPMVMCVFTDGDTNDKEALNAIIPRLRNSTVQPIAVGIGSGIQRAELELIALNNTRNVFVLTSFLALEDFVFELTQKTCEAPQLPSLNQTYTDTLVQGEKRVYKMKVPADGITVNISVSAGSTKGYWSRTDEFPSENVNDGVLSESGSTYIPSPPAAKFSRQAGSEDEDEGDLDSVYFSIEGTQDINNYTLAVMEGGSDNDNSGAVGITGFVNSVLLLFVGIQLWLNFN